jgi:hypothetical protein
MCTVWSGIKDEDVCALSDTTQRRKSLRGKACRCRYCGAHGATWQMERNSAMRFSLGDVIAGGEYRDETTVQDMVPMVGK